MKLGRVQPGEVVASFGDAIRRLTDRATYLYVDGSRYWYSTQPTVTHLAEDRANQLHEHDILDEIVRRLRDEARSRGDFHRVPLWRGNDVTVKQLVEDFATYLYLPRLRNSDVLIAAIQEGITLLNRQSETFAYAQSKDADGRYLGLVGGGSAAVQSEGGSMVVKPDEVIQHLSKYIGANVEVTLEIRAEMPDGVTEKTIRDVLEN